MVVVVVAVIIQEVMVVAVTVVGINGILLLISDFSFLNNQAIYRHTLPPMLFSAELADSVNKIVNLSQKLPH
ncbi:hypothetical protein KAM28_004589, partial [Salmonella enterica subsp. diarizonae serovar 47:k:z53:[z84]]|nr:hypothetical protein [Salmonella enterica subsp. diarizonae serovar 47:k:z53:[z84]]